MTTLVQIDQVAAPNEAVKVTATPAPAAPAVPASEPSPQPNVQPEQSTDAEVLKLTREVEDLRAELASIQRSKLAPTNRVPQDQPRLGVGLAEAQRTAAIRAAGGLAKYNMLSLNQKLAAQGHLPATTDEVEESKRYFGRHVSGVEAMKLAKEPGKYRRLRAIAREVGAF